MKKFLKYLWIMMALTVGVLLFPAMVRAAGTATVPFTGFMDYERAGEVAELVNRERRAAGIPAVALDRDLSKSAMLRAQEIAVYFSHVRPDNSDCFTAMPKNVKLPPDESLLRGENIAAGQFDPQMVMLSWMNSEGHRANILDTEFRRIGVGVFYVNGCYCWVQMFDNGISYSSGYIGESKRVLAKVAAAPENLDLSLQVTKGSQVVGGKLELAVFNRNREFGYITLPLSPDSLRWSSSLPSKATVSAGKARILSCGTTKITAALGTASVSGNIKVPHSYGKWRTVKKSTYTREGKKTRTCSGCGKKQSKAIGRKTLKAIRQPSSVKTKLTTLGNVRISWKKVPYATGYRVYRKTGNGKWKILKNVDSSVATFKDMKIKSKKRYTYAVRAYHVTPQEKKVWSKYAQSRAVRK